MLAIILFIALCIGSFLNVCIWRLPRKISIASPRRSFCPKCNTEIKWYDNIPIISWIVLLGKCRTCKDTISFSYPAVETLTAIICFFSLYHFGLSLKGIAVFLLIAVLLVITFIDLEFRIIPNKITFLGMILGLLMGLEAEYLGSLKHSANFTYLIFNRDFLPDLFYTNPFTRSMLDSFLGLILGGGAFYLIDLLYYAISERHGLGGGDMKLLAMLGAILGCRCLLTVILVGSLAGSVVGVLMIFLAKKGRFYELPFGPWLAFGALFYIFSPVPIFSIP